VFANLDHKPFSATQILSKLENADLNHYHRGDFKDGGLAHIIPAPPTNRVPHPFRAFCEKG